MQEEFCESSKLASATIGHSAIYKGGLFQSSKSVPLQRIILNQLFTFYFEEQKEPSNFKSQNFGVTNKLPKSRKYWIFL